MYHQLVKLGIDTMLEPPITRFPTDQQLDHSIDKPLRLNHPCHNQAVERHLKLVTEASLFVVGFEQ